MVGWWDGRTGTGALTRILGLERTSKGHLDPPTVCSRVSLDLFAPDLPSSPLLSRRGVSGEKAPLPSCRG